VAESSGGRSFFLRGTHQKGREKRSTTDGEKESVKWGKEVCGPRPKPAGNWAASASRACRESGGNRVVSRQSSALKRRGSKTSEGRHARVRAIGGNL